MSLQASASGIYTLKPEQAGNLCIPALTDLDEEAILVAAEAIIERRFRRQGQLTSIDETKRFMRAKLVHHRRELFGCLLLDSNQRIIDWQVLFYGTLARCAVYPREIVSFALYRESAAVIVAHQHPSGDPEPSLADRQLTRELYQALTPVGVTLLDHIIVGARYEVSMAERGLI